MIIADIFNESKVNIIDGNEHSFPKTPESLSLFCDSSKQSGSFSFCILINKKLNPEKRIVEIGANFATSDLVGEVLEVDLMKQAADGTNVGDGISIAISCPIFGIGNDSLLNVSLK